jgi:hypothetical protein
MIPGGYPLGFTKKKMKRRGEAFLKAKCLLEQTFHLKKIVAIC